MKDYYKTYHSYGDHTLCHCLRSHPLVLEWLHFLHKKYHDLDDKEILNLELRIATWIQGDMHWDTAYKTVYDPMTRCLTITGFPKFGYPDYFKVRKAQLVFLLHRIRYNKATIYYQRQSVVKIVLCITDEWELDDKRVFEEQYMDMDDMNGNIDCNVLTHDLPPCEPRPHHHHHHRGGCP